MNNELKNNSGFTPFEFYTEVQLDEVTGHSVINLKELLEKLKMVSGSVIYCHTFRTMLLHHFITEGFKNDFAHWVIDALNEEELGERLVSIDLIEYTAIRAYREKMTQIIEEYLARNPAAATRNAREERRFFFCSTYSFVVTTGKIAHTLEEFANQLHRCSNNSIFFHFIEARLRVGQPINDFSIWLSQSLGKQGLAEKINKLDPYIYTLEQLKEKISELVEQEL
ncbi:MAG: DUF5752 family protein [bacterium]